MKKSDSVRRTISKWLWWNGPKEGATGDPTVVDVESFVDSLDGAVVDEGGVMLHQNDVPVGMMLVSGGLGGLVILSWQWANGPTWWDNDLVMLVDRSQGDQRRANAEGGQTVEQPARWSVSKSLAKKAIRTVMLSNQLDETLEWDFEPAPPGSRRELTSDEIVALSNEIARRALASPIEPE